MLTDKNMAVPWAHQYSPLWPIFTFRKWKAGPSTLSGEQHRVAGSDTVCGQYMVELKTQEVQTFTAHINSFNSVVSDM